MPLNPTARFLLGVLVGLLILPTALYLYVATGHAPVATADAAMPMEAFLRSSGGNPGLRRNNPSAISRPSAPLIWQREQTFIRRIALSVMVCQISPRRRPRKECFLTCHNCSTRQTWSRMILLANPSGR